MDMAGTAEKKPPLVAIVGPTASGKSAAAIGLAARFRGEIVSADSRQVYRGMDIGTGKVLPEERAGIPHHLLDIASPQQTVTLAEYQEQAFATIERIRERESLPFLVGGTGLYVDAVVQNLRIPAVAPQPELREELGRLTIDRLVARLEAVDPESLTTIDRKNPRRLIRAIEVSETAGEPFSRLRSTGPRRYDVLLIGIAQPPDRLAGRIADRLAARLRQGLVEEVRRLQAEGVDWERLEAFGLEYRRIAEHLQGKADYDTAVARLEHDIIAYAKRQLTWFKRNERIQWMEDAQDAGRLVSQWLAARTPRQLA